LPAYDLAKEQKLNFGDDIASTVRLAKKRVSSIYFVTKLLLIEYAHILYLILVMVNESLENCPIHVVFSLAVYYLIATSSLFSLNSGHKNLG